MRLGPPDLYLKPSVFFLFKLYEYNMIKNSTEKKSSKEQVQGSPCR